MADPVVANARGAALIAAIGVGDLDWADVPSRVEVAATFTPDPAARAVHDRQYAVFRDIYKRTHGLYARHNAGMDARSADREGSVPELVGGGQRPPVVSPRDPRLCRS